ncbi:hypothetical protein JOC73_001051 [Alkaliphilus hydrothermalis]|uniref:Uncharacterized protein n=2 Tax=Alkaliphilus hydrothermalis TaxID=1482730 RepID=A0ABS2NNQ4_9FIRM|nr:hypothetical protein [Alkaliphilus hydrothermalis]
MSNYLVKPLITLLLVCFIGYFLVVIKEKFYLKNHIILIDHEVEPDLLENIDIKHFMLGATEIMAGDEVKIKMDNLASVRGTVLGIIKQENSIALLTNTKGVTNLKVSSIRKLKVISRYGKFFAKF